MRARARAAHRHRRQIGRLEILKQDQRHAGDHQQRARDGRGCDGLTQYDRAEQDGNDRVHECIGRNLLRRLLSQEPDVAGESDDAAEQRQVQHRDRGCHGDLRRIESDPLAGHERHRSLEQSPGQHLHAGDAKELRGSRRPPLLKRADAPRDPSEQDHHQVDRWDVPANPLSSRDDRRHPREREPGAEERPPCRPAAFEKRPIEQEHLHGDRRDDQRGHARRQFLLRPDDEPVAGSGEQHAREQRVTPRQPAQLRRVTEREPREHQRRGEQKAHAAAGEGRQRLDRESDAEVGRTPDQVDAPVGERDAGLQRGSAHGGNVPLSLASVQIQV